MAVRQANGPAREFYESGSIRSEQTHRDDCWKAKACYTIPAVIFRLNTPIAKAFRTGIENIL